MREDFRPGGGDVDLVEALQELLGTEVDLVMTGAVKNRCIARDIECTQELLCAV